jgi:hypothetical protein
MSEFLLRTGVQFILGKPNIVPSDVLQLPEYEATLELGLAGAYLDVIPCEDGTLELYVVAGLAPGPVPVPVLAPPAPGLAPGPALAPTQPARPRLRTSKIGHKLAIAIVARKAHQLGRQRSVGKALGDH